MKRLYKAKNNKVISGVCMGLSNYFGVDPIFVRLLFVVFLITTFFISATLVYFVIATILPEETDIIEY